MYNKSERSSERGTISFGRNSSSSPSRGRGGFSSGGSSYGSSSGYRGNNGSSGGGGQRRFGGSKRRPSALYNMDHSKFIKKAVLREEEVYVAKHVFDDFAINPKIKQSITQRGFTAPTPIQDQAIPFILEGRDLIGIANTGTGKTAAFLIPLIDKTLRARENKHEMSTLIIVPTRELAMQIEDDLRAFTDYMKIFSTCCVGGMDIRRQLRRLQMLNHFVIGTPGRLKDLIMRRALRLDQFENIVLDEVDRMLDMGFIDDIRFIVDQLPKERQSLFFSATMDRKIEPLMQAFLTNPVTVSVKTGITSDNVDQDIVRVNRSQVKIEVLHDLLKQEGFSKVLIFGKTKMGVENLHLDLIERGFKVEAIHGDKTQGRRQRALDNFKRGGVDILVATDVAARGLDINGVSHVINYDLPENYEDYIHRIGRTGRANMKGIALTFVD